MEAHMKVGLQESANLRREVLRELVIHRKEGLRGMGFQRKEKIQEEEKAEE